MKVYERLTDLIGNTPLFELKKIKEKYGLKANIIAKLESFNPAGSVKDRVAYSMIKGALESGKLNKNSTIIEPTSGNTGIGLASIAASLGIKIILTMPETMSVERRQILASYGAQIVLTEGSKGMKGAIEKANELAKTIENSFIPSQFENLLNPEIHFKTTGKEIYDDLDGKIDIFMAGVGTGGTISGVGRYLKSKNKDIKVIALEPATSPVLSKGEAGSHKIQGIGAGFVPKTLDTSIYDAVVTVENDEALEMCKIFPKVEGLSIGISSAAVLVAAIKEAKKEENKDKNIVVLFPDSGEKYLSVLL